MRLNNTIWMLLLCILTVAVTACSKDEPEDFAQNWSTGYLGSDYLQYMIESAEGQEVVSYDNANPYGIDGVTMADAHGGTLKFRLGADATKVLFRGGCIPVTSHVFSVYYCIELEFDEMEKIGVLSSDYLLGRATYDNCAGYVDVFYMNDANGRYVQLPSATFNSEEKESCFEVLLAPNTTSKTRYVIYMFAPMAQWTGFFTLIICQPADNA